MDSERDREVADGRFLRGTPPVRRWARRWLVVGFIGAGLLFLLFPLVGDNGVGAFMRLSAERNRLRLEVEELERQKSELQHQIDTLRDDPAALERLARERHNMRGPEEQVLVIVPPQSGADRSP